MNKQKMLFWVKCPECGHRFGVLPDTVLKYIRRVRKEMEGMLGKFEGKVEELEKKKKEQAHSE